MKGFSLFLLIMGMLFGVFSCSLFEPEEGTLEADDEIYRQGLEAFENQNYDQALEILRKIQPVSLIYPRTLELIQKISFQRVEDAMADKDYRTALRELNKIPKTDKNYPKAQQLREIIVTEMAFNAYQNAETLARKIIILEKISNMAIQTENQERLLEVVAMIGSQLNQVKEEEQIDALLALLQATLAEQQDSELVYTGLEKAFEAYNQFNDDPRFRNQLLRLIAELKLKL